MFKQKPTPNFFANFLLILLFAFSILTLCLPVPQTEIGNILLKIVQGGCLGGLGGALADWYAVTALFKKPFGLPLPHTNIIARNKDKIADKIAHFVVVEFLNEAEMIALLQKLEIGKRVNQKIFQMLFSKKKTGEAFDLKGQKASIALAKAYLLEDVLLSAENISLLGRLLRMNLEKHEDKIISYVEQRVKEQGGSFLGWAVGNSIGRRVVGALEGELKKIDLNDPVFLEKWSQYKQRFLKSFQERKQEKGEGLRAAPSVWEKKKASLEEIFIECSEMVSFESMIETYLSDYMTRHLPEIRNHSFIFLQSVMKKWGGVEISKRLEQAVGSDLAYIRVNGALVGFLTSAFIEGGILAFKMLF
ncbi:DUF445 family protein [Acetobacteraceae bacterium]|nr:DUF445 family protein [Acetobacteraceae bacterium]